MDKSPDAFRTISEVAEDLDVPQHVLRFWETRFAQIRPLKRGGGRRYYRPDDVDLLKGIRHLLYGEGYTIRGVQRILKEEGVRFVQSVGRGEQAVAAPDLGEQADSYPDSRESPRPGEDYAPRRNEDGFPSDDAEANGSALHNEDLQQLRAALDELIECDRILGMLKAVADPVAPD